MTYEEFAPAVFGAVRDAKGGVVSIAPPVAPAQLWTAVRNGTLPDRVDQR